MAAGRMPALMRIRREGAWGSLQAGEPLTGPAVWTTVATGRHPETHGIVMATTPRRDGGGVAPVGQAQWRAPAFWQIAEAAGRRVMTIGWPFASPATGWPGIHVNPSFAVASGEDFESWALLPRCVSPESLRSRLRELRLHPTDVTGDMLAPFVPGLAAVDQHRDARLVELAVIVASATTMHAAATALIEAEEWDVAALQYDLLERVRQGFSGNGSDPTWGGVTDTAYQFADAMLGRLIELAGEDTTIVVLSPNGVGHTGPRAPWRAHGFLAASGRWIHPGKILPPARLVDVAPTVLARFGLGMETDVTVLRDIAPGHSRRRVTVPPRLPPASPRHVEELRALGYDDALTDPQTEALETAEAARLAAMGEALLERGRIVEALSALLAARRLLPPESPVGLQRLALCYLLQGEAAQCRAVGEAMRRSMPWHGWGDLAIAAGFALEENASGAWPHMARAFERGGHDPELLVPLAVARAVYGADAERRP